METIETKRLAEDVGVEVLGVDVDRLRNDNDLAAWCLGALEEYGVVLFRELNADDQEQVDFCRKLGPLNKFESSPPYEVEEVMEISFDPSNPNAEFLKSNDYWHADGLLDDLSAKIAVLSARVVAETGGETEFASSYAAYDALSDEDKEHFADLRVIHSFEAVQRQSHPDPTPEQLAVWAARRPVREHPLVWTHGSGRRSLVIGGTTSHIVGMGVDEGRELLADLVQRATTPDRVYSHTWAVGDMVLWDNTGLLHRACEFDRRKPRRMNRSTVTGTEAIK